MKRSRFTDRQMMDALKRVEAGLAVTELCRELGISRCLRSTSGDRRSVAWIRP